MKKKNSQKKQREIYGEIGKKKSRKKCRQHKHNSKSETKKRKNKEDAIIQLFQSNAYLSGQKLDVETMTSGILEVKLKVLELSCFSEDEVMRKQILKKEKNISGNEMCKAISEMGEDGLYMMYRLQMTSAVHQSNKESNSKEKKICEEDEAAAFVEQEEKEAECLITKSEKQQKACLAIIRSTLSPNDTISKIYEQNLQLQETPATKFSELVEEFGKQKLESFMKFLRRLQIIALKANLSCKYTDDKKYVASMSNAENEHQLSLQKRSEVSQRIRSMTEMEKAHYTEISAKNTVTNLMKIQDEILHWLELTDFVMEKEALRFFIFFLIHQIKKNLLITRKQAYCENNAERCTSASDLDKCSNEYNCKSEFQTSTTKAQKDM